MITVLILIVALGILGWGLYRAKPMGKLGILAWLQSVALMAPWLIFFGLATAGIYLNLAGVLLLFVLAVGLYIGLGSRLRAAANDPALKQASAALRSEPSADQQGDAVSNADSQTSLNPLAAASSNPASQAGDPKSSDPKSSDPEILPIPADDLQAIKGIFGIETFFATETIPYQNGVIFRGNLRGEVEASHTRLTANLSQRLGDRYRLFLLEGPDARPVVVVLPSSNDPKPTTVVQKIFAILLGLSALVTCMEASGVMLGFDLISAPQRFGQVLPMTLGLFVVLGAHEIGHRVLAKRYQVRLSPPFLIPTWQVGSLGAITRFETLLPNRTALFDIAFAGPAAGGAIALLMLIVGLLLSHEGSGFPISTEFFQGSILVGTLSRVVLGDSLQQSVVTVHPLMLTGWLGLLLTAINVMPAGQLDGGRIMQSIYGRKTAGRTTVITLVLLGLAALVNPLALYWAILILFLQRDLERPALNELSEPDDTRAALGLLVFFLMAAILLPLTPSLAGRLGIGG